ncbi:conserved hypothetical protein [Vibrio chagasii]|nr:conserved hypothetical protein [Vibrio chagasii]CAH6897693.1 conserved hypothetical protein [Vibrio chagasii]CAH6902015.1 conserved hypothetical protein [Vibrio chagasii]CAH6949501.1 conserved hypothetical protein [Vibrio chagasii]CAH7139504.1 conserved hypothetical protein [Vibrio chagasii]
MAEFTDWRKLQVYRDSRFESLESKLCTNKGSTDPNSFGAIKDLMVFAALVGFQLGKYEPLNDKSRSTSILLETYASTNKDSYIYLIALSKEPSLDILKNEQLRKAISIFEGYCNGGLKHIDSWLMKNLSEPLVTNTLFNQTLEFLIEND